MWPRVHSVRVHAPVLDRCERLCARYHVSATEISLYLNATRSNTGEKTEIKSQTHIGTGQ